MPTIRFECGHCLQTFESPDDLKVHFESHVARGDIEASTRQHGTPWDKVSPSARLERLERRLAEIEQYLELYDLEH